MAAFEAAAGSWMGAVVTAAPKVTGAASAGCAGASSAAAASGTEAGVGAGAVGVVAWAASGEAAAVTGRAYFSRFGLGLVGVASLTTPTGETMMRPWPSGSVVLTRTGRPSWAAVSVMRRSASFRTAASSAASIAWEVPLMVTSPVPLVRRTALILGKSSAWVSIICPYFVPFGGVKRLTCQGSSAALRSSCTS